jgi:cold shock CspA family protein
MITGFLRNMKNDKDFCFITHGVNRDVFLHKTEYQGNWSTLLYLYKMGPVKLEFEIIETVRGLRAINAQLSEDV